MQDGVEEVVDNDVSLFTKYSTQQISDIQRRDHDVGKITQMEGKLNLSTTK